MRATTPFWSRPMTETTARLRATVMSGPQGCRSPAPSPFRLVRGDLLRTRLGLLLVRGDLELIARLHHVVVKLGVSGEDGRHGRLLEDGLPGALRLARAAIDTLIRVDI